MASGINQQIDQFPPICWCAIYTRQSRTPNDEYSSCDAQFDACDAFIRSRFPDGWCWNGRRYDDVAESSETLDRPELQRLLEDVCDGRMDRVVIYRLDRLSRRLFDWTQFLQELRDHDVALTIVTLPDLGLTAGDTFFLNIMASFAEFEQEMTRERMADARAAHKRRGRRVAGVVPYGYEADPITKQLVIVRQEANRIRKMFQWAADGKLPTEIAEIANKRRWRTKQRTSRNGRVTGGGKWTARQILATLSNPAYVGLIRDGDRTRPGIHQAIVDQALFDQVQEAIASRRTQSRGRGASMHWPLRGVLRCGQCGRPMSPSFSGHKNIRYRYYRCRSEAGGKPPCKSVSLPALEIEDFVIETIRKQEIWEAHESDNEKSTDGVRELFDGWPKLTYRTRSKILPNLVQDVIYHAKKSTVTVHFDPDAIIEYLRASPPPYN